MAPNQDDAKSGDRADCVDRPLKTEARDYLRMMYEEHAEQARQHETLRAEGTALSVALIAGLLAYAATVRESRDWIGLCVCFVGALGMILNQKHYERNRLHTSILRNVREQLERELDPGIWRVSAQARARHANEWPRLSKLRLHHLWIGIYAVALVIGFALTAAALLLPGTTAAGQAMGPAGTTAVTVEMKNGDGRVEFYSMLGSVMAALVAVISTALAFRVHEASREAGFDQKRDNMLEVMTKNDMRAAHITLQAGALMDEIMNRFGTTSQARDWMPDHVREEADRLFLELKPLSQATNILDKRGYDFETILALKPSRKNQLIIGILLHGSAAWTH